jgi:hypothetical protein
MVIKVDVHPGTWYLLPHTDRDTDPRGYWLSFLCFTFSRT